MLFGAPLQNRVYEFESDDKLPLSPVEPVETPERMGVLLTLLGFHGFTGFKFQVNWCHH